MSQQDHIDPNRRIAAVLDVFKGRWKGEIIIALRERQMRFKDLRQAMPSVSARALTESLRSLERDGVITRQQFAGIPPHVEYDLTEQGRGLLPLLDHVQAWGERHLACVEACRASYDAQAERKA